MDDKTKRHTELDVSHLLWQEGVWGSVISSLVSFSLQRFMCSSPCVSQFWGSVGIFLLEKKLWALFICFFFIWTRTRSRLESYLWHHSWCWCCFLLGFITFPGGFDINSQPKSTKDGERWLLIIKFKVTGQGWVCICVFCVAEWPLRCCRWTAHVLY